MIDIETYNKLKEEAQEKSKKAWEEYQKVSKINSDILLQLVDLKGKYIKTLDGDYLFVSEEYNTTWHYNDSTEAILLTGLGFTYSSSDYIDDCYAKWSFCHEVWIRLDDFKQDVSKITEITKEEFNQAFDKMIKEMTQNHYDNCDEPYC